MQLNRFWEVGIAKSLNKQIKEALLQTVEKEHLQVNKRFSYWILRSSLHRRFNFKKNTFNKLFQPIIINNH